MRVPIQREASGRFTATLDFEQTPKGFEDAFENSRFYRRYVETRALGEYGSPKLDTLAGNQIAQLHRSRTADENRVCLNLIQVGHFHDRFLQMEVLPYGPYGNSMRDCINANPTLPYYLTFRLEYEEDEEGERKVTQISGADFTTE